MRQNYKGLLRQISKIYPPQITQAHKQIILYNPLQQWVESHTSTSMQDLIEISDHELPLFLNSNSEEIIMQSHNDVFLQYSPNEWMKTIEKKFYSEKQIVSCTIKKNQTYFNVNSSGSINAWKISIDDQEENEHYNPQSMKNLEKSSSDHSQYIQTSINSQKLIKEYRHGYDISPIVVDDENLYTLHKLDHDNITFHKIMKTDILSQQGQSAFYRCYFPENITKFMTYKKNLFAYGGQNALLMDQRTQSIVCDFNDDEDSDITCIRNDPSNENSFLIARNKSILRLDCRFPSRLTDTGLIFDEDIDSIEFTSENQKSYCAVAFKISSKVAFTEL